MALREVLKIEEREIISRELSRYKSARHIGQMLGRHHSTISREINRNGGASAYRAVEAQRRCEENLARPKERKLEALPRLHDAVNDGLREKWSPKQIGYERTIPTTRIYVCRTKRSTSVCISRPGVSCGPS